MEDGNRIIQRTNPDRSHPKPNASKPSTKFPNALSERALQPHRSLEHHFHAAGHPRCACWQHHVLLPIDHFFSKQDAHVVKPVTVKCGGYQCWLSCLASTTHVRTTPRFLTKGPNAHRRWKPYIAIIGKRRSRRLVRRASSAPMRAAPISFGHRPLFHKARVACRPISRAIEWKGCRGWCGGCGCGTTSLGSRTTPRPFPS